MRGQQPVTGSGPQRRWQHVAAGLCAVILAAFTLSQIDLAGKAARAHGAATRPARAAIVAAEAVTHRSRLLSLDMETFECEQVGRDESGLLCVSRVKREDVSSTTRDFSWLDIGSVCHKGRRTRIAEEGSHDGPSIAESSIVVSVVNASGAQHAIARTHVSLFVLPVHWWAALRIAAYRQLHVVGQPSSFPVKTTVLPWRALPFVSDNDAMGKARLLLSPAFLFESRFDALLDGVAMCQIAAAMIVRGPDAPAARERAVAMIQSPNATVLALAPRELHTSAFWRTVYSRGLALSVAAPDVRDTWCAESNEPGELLYGVLCARRWLSVTALWAGLVATQATLFSRASTVHLHSRARLLRLMPVADKAVHNELLLEGIRSGNSTMVNLGFNDAATMPLAGSYVTAFNVIVTPRGSLQSRVKRRWAAATHTERQLYHTICEPSRFDPYPEHRVDELPLHDEVIVLSHRIEANIYHWTTETIAKLAPMLDYARSNPRVMLHIGNLPPSLRSHAQFRLQHLAMLGLRWWARTIVGYVRARVVHYIDNHECGYPHGMWQILLRERYRTSLGFPNDAVIDGLLGHANAVSDSEQLAAKNDESSSSDDERNPDGSSVALSAGASAAAESPSLPSPVNKSIVILRRGSSRRIKNEAALLVGLRGLSGVHVTELSDWNMPSQEDVFRAVAGADLLIGAHGAGQTNAIVAAPGTCLIEFIPSNWLVLCYFRLAGLLGLRYHMFVVSGDRTSPIRIDVPGALRASRECLGLHHPPHRPHDVGTRMGVNTGLVIPSGPRTGAEVARAAAGTGGLGPAPSPRGRRSESSHGDKTGGAARKAARPENH